MIKIIIINHTFQIDYFYRRWKLLAYNHPDLDITLFAPNTYYWGKSSKLTFGKIEEKQAIEIDEKNFHIKSIKMLQHKFKTWTSPDMLKFILDIKPDIIYHIGTELQDSALECIKIRDKYLKNAKCITFTMRGPTDLIHYRQSDSLIRKVVKMIYEHILRSKRKKILEGSDAIFCHYPEGRDCIRKEGYNKPIYMQTQVGVDTDKFHPCYESRKKIRNKYKISDETYLFGSATRFTSDKGLSEIIKALPQDGNYKFLMMGSGLPQEIDAINKEISIRHLEDKIILPGFIDWHDMSDYWNALDCAVHVPRTTSQWVETFSLSIVQAMATGLPIIGNTSGSVPYQIGPDGLIVPEGNIEELHKKMIWVMDNKNEAKIIGKKMMERSIKCFGIYHLNEIFYDTILDIVQERHDTVKEDMTQYKVY